MNWLADFCHTPVGWILIVLTGTFMPIAVLTRDRITGLWSAVVIILLFALSFLLKDKFKKRPVASDAARTSIFEALDPFVLFYTSVGTVVVIMYGFRHDSILVGKPGDDWHSWHLGAAIWAIWIALCSLFRLPHRPLIPFLFGVGVIAYFALPRSNEVWVPFAISGYSLIVDAYIIGSVLKGKNDNNGDEDDALRLKTWALLLIADLPSFCAFAILAVYTHRNAELSHLDAFTSGAVSFQLIASKGIFVLIEAGALNVVRPVLKVQSAGGHSA